MNEKFWEPYGEQVIFSFLHYIASIFDTENRYFGWLLQGLMWFMLVRIKVNRESVNMFSIVTTPTKPITMEIQNKTNQTNLCSTLLQLQPNQSPLKFKTRPTNPDSVGSGCFLGYTKIGQKKFSKSTYWFYSWLTSKNK